MLRLDNVLVQQASERNCLLFAFRGKYWSVYTLVISIALFIGTSKIRGIDSVHFKEYLVLGGYILGCLFIWSSIFSYFKTALLTIDGDRRIVEYRSSSVFGKEEWTKDFSDFSEVRIWRPGRKSFLKVVLRLKDNEEIPLGTSEAGIFGSERAQEIARSIAVIMDISIIEEPTVSWKL